MPTYVFENPETGETREVQQKIKHRHEYADEDGLQWVRVWTRPNFKTNSKIDPFSETDYMAKSADKRDNFGDMWTRSAELSEAREKRFGKDPVKEKFYKSYSKKRNGLKHPHK